MELAHAKGCNHLVTVALTLPQLFSFSYQDSHKLTNELAIYLKALLCSADDGESNSSKIAGDEMERNRIGDLVKSDYMNISETITPPQKKKKKRRRRKCQPLGVM